MARHKRRRSAHAPQKKKCTGHSKRTGKPCDAWAIHGGTVCVSHGGSAPQVIAAAAVGAARMEAHEHARRMLARAGVDADPLEHLLESLYRAAALVEVWGSMCAAIDEQAEAEALEHGTLRGELGYHEAAADSPDELSVIATDRMLTLNRHGEAQVHPFMAEYERALERRAKFAKMCIDAGIAEKTLSLHHRQVEMAQHAFEATLEELGLSAPKRQEARRAYAEQLRVAA